MCFKLVLCLENRAAIVQFAHLQLPTAVHTLHVPPKVGAVRKGCVAHTAVMIRLLCVDVPVLLQMVVCPETFATDITCERFLTSVPQNVTFQLHSLGET